jgi:hypothetical protein
MISLWFMTTYKKDFEMCPQFTPWTLPGWTVTFPPKIEKRDPDDFGRAEFISVGHSIKVSHMI